MALTKHWKHSQLQRTLTGTLGILAGNYES
jgi:hypothetical protein